jgi:endonuclease/exonuclease/phosphatase family metal-dependent hydrolase
MHAVFCPTVTQGSEHYGHGLFSRWPVEVVHRAFLPSDKKGWWKEPRSALWAKVLIDGRPVHVITTHLGLGRTERLMQMEELLGPGWVGAIPQDEPVILCGDFNLAPGSRGYGLAAARLLDAQAAQNGRRPLRTFTSARPFTRIDHVFISQNLFAARVVVPRNHLTRFASDHLPLVVDLQSAPAAVETPRHMPAK